jgi:hypothetical protein
MKDSMIEKVNPYNKLVDQYVNGLDAIITSIGTGGPETVTVDDLTDAVYNYVASVYTDIISSPTGIATVHAMIANAINGYLDHGGSSSNLQQLLSVPTTNLENLFGRLANASGSAIRLKGNVGRHQMVLAMGEASVFYWRNQIDTAGSWAAYMSGNVAIDYASMPYWADAAMFGAQFDYNQVNGTDGAAASMIFPATLIGSLAVGAGKVVFGWVPKNVGFDSSECGCSGVAEGPIWT